MNRGVIQAILAAVLTAAPAAAQHATPQPPSSRPVISLAPDNPARWDAAVHVGWLGKNKSDIAPDWNDWYDAASFGASIGRYWTPHLKSELDVSTSTPGTVQVENPLFLPGNPFPYYRPREHRFRAAQAGAALAYQFLENRWFHPFVTGGLVVTYETERAGAAIAVPYFRDPQTPVTFPALEDIATDSTRVHPFAGAGFKAYVSERAFIRTDVRVAFTTDRAEWVTWRGGVGFDF